MFATGHHMRISVRSISRRRPLSLTHRSSLTSHGVPIDVHPEVEDALANGHPVVALESTIITHGMPYPTSLEMAQSVENIVRSTGSIPATIGLVEGRVKIGLQPTELARLASRSTDPVKLSRRDIAPAIASRKDGGTTCSSTLIFAALAGIKIFATGGLGGVHRGGEKTMDISADLHELTRCPVGLVSAGVKSILDIGRTLEYLETLGVPVVSYAESNDFPAFYTRKSGFKSPWSIDDPQAAARILYVQRQLGMSNGILFAVPIPEKHEVHGTLLQEAIETALRESEETGVSKLGKDVTPWLLKRVGELTSGKSLESNIALVQNTALVGGQIAVEYAKLASGHQSGEDHFYSGFITESSSQILQTSKLTEYGSGHEIPSPRKATVVVVGCAAVDITSKAEALIRLDQKSTYPGKVSVSLGGVARNIAEATHRIMSESTENDASTLLVAPIGDDEFGKLIRSMTKSLGMRTDGLVPIGGWQSAVCNLLLDSHGELQSGVSDMDLPHAWEADRILAILRDHRPQLLALDGNLSSDTLTTIVTESLKMGIRSELEPTSVVKSLRILPAITANLPRSTRSVISFVSPNLIELAQMYQHARNTSDLMSDECWWNAIDSFGLGSQFRADLAQLARKRGIVQMAVNLLPVFQHIVIKCGKLGVMVVMRQDRTEASAWATQRSNPHHRYIVTHSPTSDEMVVIQHFPPLQVTQNVALNTTGAGDSLVGTLLAILARDAHAFSSPETLSRALDIAQRAAILTLQSPHAVSPSLSSLKPT
ncbi:indigoidine synthase A-like protein [Boletus edulis]|nr:indigoidine synthase A-like protein [Boletus edulis]